MNRSPKLLVAACLLSWINISTAHQIEDFAFNTKQANSDQVLTQAIDGGIVQSNDNRRAFVVDVKGYINSDGTREPYAAYRHAMDDIENRVFVGSQTEDDKRPLAMAWSADGTQLYAISRTEQKNLLSIDPMTAAVTELGGLIGLGSGQSIQGMTIDEGNTCYVIATDDQNHDTFASLYTCDLSTGALSLVGSQSTAPDLHDIAATCDGKMFGVDSASKSLYEVYKQDGSASYVGTMGVNSDNGLFNLTFDRKFGRLYQYVLSTSGIYTAFALVDQNDGQLTFTTDIYRLGVMVGAIESSCDERVDNFALHSGFAGAWINPNTGGQGFMLDVYPDSDVFFAAWYTYADDDTGTKALGDAAHRWFTASGAVGDDQVVELTLYNSTGGVFDDPAMVDTQLVGSLTIEFEDCTFGQVSYEFNDSTYAGTFPIQRVAADNIAACEARSAALVGQ
ncbi:hypothetical protein [Marinicella meishanensis]|uniref:hypothetical protein n=1 Tax=Marinicella meishanensis TaxID=2873263 RepID=UPI001CBFD31F|nr:hypothetical protein [Marinicella sp. NBU2979]